MQSTILIISLTVITGLTVGYFLFERRSKNMRKNSRPEMQKDEGELKTQ